MKYTIWLSMTAFTKTTRPIVFSRWACQFARYLSDFWVYGVYAEIDNLCVESGNPR
jgi:hypothetical protein